MIQLRCEAWGKRQEGLQVARRGVALQRLELKGRTTLHVECVKGAGRGAPAPRPRRGKRRESCIWRIAVAFQRL